MEKVDINTLTEEQKKLLDLGYKIYINNDGKLVTEEPEIFSQELIEIKIQQIKQKYQDLIFSQYSLTDQLNMSNEAMQIMAFAQFEKRDFTEEEKTRLFEIQEAKVWVDTQREKCKNEILELGN